MIKQRSLFVLAFLLAATVFLVGEQRASVLAQDLPRLIYIYPGGPQEDLEQVQQAMSEYMADKIGATIELRPIDWGAYNDQIGLINASGEQYDIAFTAPWINNYYNNIAQEYMIPLDDLFQEHAPGLWDSMSPETWEAARVDGSIYGVINQQIFVKPFGPYIRTDVLDAIDLLSEFEALTSYSDLTPIMAAVKTQADQDETLTDVTYNLSQILVAENWGYDPIAAGLVVSTTDDTAQVQIFSETEGYRQAAQLIREWYEAGYAPSDVAMWAEMDTAWQAGQYAVRVSDIVKPGGNAEVEARWGQPVTSVAIAEPVLTTAGVTATLNGISYTSQHPDLAMKFLELLNTDPVFYNLLAKGIEGEHWEWMDQDQLLIRLIPDSGYAPNTDWMFGNVFNSYYTDASQVGAWPETAALNRSSRPSPILGFTFNSAPVDTEIASVTAAIQEFGDPIGSGLVETEEGIARLNEALQAAGIETIRAEMQRQIDAWKAAQS